MADLVVRIDATTAGFDAQMAKAQKSTLRYEASLKLATKAQAEFDAAVASFGATSAEATAAQARLTAATKRTEAAQTQAAIATKRAAEIQVASSAKAAAAAEAAAAKQAAALKKFGSVAGGIGAAAAIGLGLAAKAAAGFNAQMAEVVTLAKQSDAAFSGADAAALSAATGGFAQIGISASEAADAEIELIKAGVSVKDILGGGLTGTLNLAAAGQLNVADATSIAAQAMTQFQLAGKDLPHIADLLSAGANKALGSVQDLGVALSYAGGPAKLLGVSIEDTVATLAEFAQAGLIGEKGGAALQTMFARLVKPTGAAADEMKKYNLSLYDSQGNFVGMSKLAGQLAENLGGLSLETRNAALQTIFGQRGFRAAAILYQDGAEGAAKWAGAVNDAGNAAKTAAGKLNSAQGDWDKFRASVTNTAIAIGQDLQPAVRTSLQTLTSFADVIGGIPGPVRTVAVELGLVVAALGLGTFAFTRIKGAALSFGKTLGFVTAAEGTAGTASGLMAAKMSLAANKMFLLRGAAIAAALALNEVHTDDKVANGFLDIGKGAAVGTAILPGWGTAIGAAAGALLGLRSASQDTSINIDALTASFDKNTGAATANSKAVASKLAGNLLPVLTKAGITVDTYSDALLGNVKAQAAVLDGAKNLGIFGDIIVGPMDDARRAAAAYRQELAETQHQQAILATQHHSFAPTLAQNAKVFGQLGDTMGKATGATKENTDATNANAAAANADSAAQAALNGVLVGRLNSMAALTLQIDSAKTATKDLTGATKDGGKSLNLMSVDGATLAQTLTGIATTASQVTGSTKIQNAALERARGAIANIGHAAGLTTGASAALAEQLLTQAAAAQKVTNTPAKSTVTAPGAAQALATLLRIKSAEDALYSKQIVITTIERLIHQGGTSLPQHVATGGLIRGPGTETSDSIPARLSKNEVVINAAAARAFGVDRLLAINAMRQPAPKSAPGFANGGTYDRMNYSQPVGGGGGSQTVVVQAPSGPQKITLDIGGDKTLTGVIQQVAQGAINGQAVRNAARQRAR